MLSASTPWAIFSVPLTFAAEALADAGADAAAEDAAAEDAAAEDAAAEDAAGDEEVLADAEALPLGLALALVLAAADDAGALAPADEPPQALRMANPPAEAPSRLRICRRVRRCEDSCSEISDMRQYYRANACSATEEPSPADRYAPRGG
ncbi:MAG: hypothetical protein ACYDAG_17270 [Chloroflexota bacterium]